MSYPQTFLQVRVYYEDTDETGMVYHSRYINFMERGRTEAWRTAQTNLSELLTSGGVIFVVHTANVSFKKPAKFEDLLWVSTQIIEAKSASIVYEHRITLNEQDGPEYCCGHIRLACIDAKNLRPTRIPDAFIKELNR